MYLLDHRWRWAANHQVALWCGRRNRRRGEWICPKWVFSMIFSNLMVDKCWQYHIHTHFTLIILGYIQPMFALDSGMKLKLPVTQSQKLAVGSMYLKMVKQLAQRRSCKRTFFGQTQWSWVNYVATKLHQARYRWFGSDWFLQIWGLRMMVICPDDI